MTHKRKQHDGNQGDQNGRPIKLHIQCAVISSSETGLFEAF